MSGRFDHLADEEADDSAEVSVHAQYLRSRLMTSAQLRNLPPPAPLVGGWLYLDSLALLYGPPGVSKTFIALDLANTVSSGCTAWYGGAAVTNGPVLYNVGEGASGIGIRNDAWDAHNGRSGAVTWLPEAVNIYDRRWAEALAEVVAELRPVLVVIDTFARSIVGADENSARDVGQAIAHLDLIRSAAGSCVLVVHHSGKDRSAGARGSTALKGALNTELEVSGAEGRISLRNTKQKDGPEQAPLNLMLQPVAGTESVVIVEAYRSSSSAELPPAALDTLTALREIDVPGGVSAATWQKAADHVAERTFFRHRSGLLTQGFVVNIGTEAQPKYRPSDAEVES